MFIRGVSILALFMILIFKIGIVLPLWYILLFIY